MAMLLISLVVSDPYKNYQINSNVYTSPKRTQSLHSPPALKRPYTHNFVGEIKRKVPTGPNPVQSPKSPPTVKMSYNYNFF